jgi:DNA primase
VVEGVTDVWRVGPPAVALFGKSASPEQARLLAAGWYGKPVVILLDADAAEEAEKLRRQVAALHPGPVVVVALPEGLDPGSCPRDALWELVRAEAARQGANLPAETPVAA